MNIEKMREEFEAWLAQYESGREKNGWMPLETHIQVRMYEAWRASRESLVIELPQKYESDYGAGIYQDDEGDLYQASDIAEAIHASGVKTK